MAKADIWMPLYIGDYLADTMHLTTEQHGAYLLLIMSYWRNGGPLPNNDQQLSAICRLGPNAWSNAQAMLKHFFDSESLPGYWVHSRIEKEMLEAEKNKHKRVVKAQKAAEARWRKDAPSNAPSNAPSIPQAMLEECPSPSPSPYKDQDQKHLSQIDEVKPGKPERIKTLKASDLIAMGVHEQHAKDWLAIRKQKRTPLTETAMAATKREADKAGMTIPDVIRVAAENGWSGFKAEWLKGDKAAISKHHGFQERDYFEGLTLREDGTYGL